MEKDIEYERLMYRKYNNFKVFLQNHLKGEYDLSKIVQKIEAFYKLMDFVKNEKPHARVITEKLYTTVINLATVLENSKTEKAEENKISMRTTMNYKKVIEKRKRVSNPGQNQVSLVNVEQQNVSIEKNSTPYQRLLDLNPAEQDGGQRPKFNEYSFENYNSRISLKFDRPILVTNNKTYTLNEERRQPNNTLDSFFQIKNKQTNIQANRRSDRIEEENSNSFSRFGKKGSRAAAAKDTAAEDDQNFGNFMTGKQILGANLNKKNNLNDTYESGNRIGKNSINQRSYNTNSNFNQLPHNARNETLPNHNLINAVNRSVFGTNVTLPQLNSNLRNEENDYANGDGNSSLNSNQNKNPALRKKFVPPFKDSAQKQRIPGNRLQKDNSGNDSSEKVFDERYKGLDPKMIEMIEADIVDRSPSITYDDIAGLKFAKKTIFEIIVWPMLRPDIFNGLRAPPKGLLLFGPPGTGKTMIGKAIATESKATFFSISASSLTSKWVGEGEKMVKTLFSIAQIHAPSVIFIDEIDSLLCARSENDIESSRRIKTEFMVQLEGTRSTNEERLLIIGATNRPQELDEAVRRRFTKRLYIPLPNKDARKELIKTVIASEIQKGNNYSLSETEIDEITELTKGYSGADMRNLCAEASMIPIRSIHDIKSIMADNLRATDISDFKNALKTVKATVSARDLGMYLDWNRSYGSFEFSAEDLEN